MVEPEWVGPLRTTRRGDPRSEACRHHREKHTGVPRAAGLPPGERRAWKRWVPRSEHTGRTAGASFPRASPSPQVETEYPPVMPQGPAPPQLPHPPTPCTRGAGAGRERRGALETLCCPAHTWGWGRGRERKRRGALDCVFQSVERARFSSESRGLGSRPGRSRQREVRPGAASALSLREAGKVPAGRAPRRWAPLLPVRDLPGSPVFPVLSCSVAVLSQAHVGPGSLSTGFSVLRCELLHRMDLQ